MRLSTKKCVLGYSHTQVKWVVRYCAPDDNNFGDRMAGVTSDP